MAVARIAFVCDAGGGGSSATPDVAAAVNAAFGRFGAGVGRTWLFIGGDEYSPYCTASVIRHYDQFLDQPNISPARTVMTPGNHTNGPGGSNTPDVRAWLDYNASRGTLTRTDGGWINQSEGIPLTDQHVDIGPIRFIFVNSGAVLGMSAVPGWPVPHVGGSVRGNARVAWLRSAWAPGTRNVVVTHHPRWSYYGNHHDNPTMQNLIDEILGRNDGSGPHSPLILQGHDHNMQLFKPRHVQGAYPGLRSVVAGLCSTAPYTAKPGKGNTSQLSWLQFANISPGQRGFLQLDITASGTLVLSFVDARDTSGRLMTNTMATGLTGKATASITTTGG